MLVFNSDRKTTSINILGILFTNNEENLQAMLDFTAWDNIAEIDKVFPFLARYNEDRILFNADKPQDNSPEQKEYRKGLFFGYGMWMKSIFRLYNISPYSTFSSSLKDEMVDLFTAAREAAMSKIDIIRSQEVSSRTANISAIQQQAVTAHVKEFNKKNEAIVNTSSNTRAESRKFSSNLKVDRLAQQLENENKVQLLTTVISNKDTIVENLQLQLTEKDQIIKSLQEELESLKSQLLLSLNTTNTQIGWE